MDDHFGKHQTSVTELMANNYNKRSHRKLMKTLWDNGNVKVKGKPYAMPENISHCHSPGG